MSYSPYYPRRCRRLVICITDELPADKCCFHAAADAALVELPTFLDHINTVSVTEQFVPSIHAAHSTGALYFMGETNSAACHGLAGVSDTLGAALWMLDYSLTGASLGMDGLYFHNGVTFPYSSWEPNAVNDTMPHVNGL